MDTSRVWFVNGTSKGVRLTLVKALLHEGYRVAVTTDDVASLKIDIGGSHPGKWLPLKISHKDKQSQGRALLEAIRHFGQVDEVVNDHRLWINRR